MRFQCELSMRFKARLCVAAVVSFFVLGSVCLAQRSVTFRTSLEITGMYEVNPLLFSDSEKESKDYVKDAYEVRYSPGIGVDYAADIGEFHLTYDPYLTTYYPSGHERYSIKTQTGQLSGQLYFTDKLSLILSDQLSDSVVGAARQSDQPGLGARYTENGTQERVRYAPGTRLVLTLGHGSDGIWYRRAEDKSQDREENFALGSAGYKLREWTEVGVTGDWGLIDYKTPDRYDDRYQYSARGYIQQRLEAIDADARAEAGFMTTEYKDKGQLRGIATRSTGFDGSLSVARNLGEDTRAEVAASSGYVPSDVLAGDFYQSRAVRASVRHVFLDRFEAMFEGRAESRRYVEESARRDYAYGVSATGGYKIFKWLSLRAGYSFAKVDSKLETYEYDNHEVHISLYFEDSFSR